MGNPTEELCAKLDEMGVEYDTYDLPNGNHGVSWIDGNNIEWEVVPLGENFEIHALQLVTPEQAVAATVSTGTLTAEQVRECTKEVYFEGYSDGATHRVNGIKETDWQAIADRLNAMLGAGTCRNISKVTDTSGRKVRFVCSECDAWIDSEFIWNHEYSNGESPWVKDCKLNYCPNCGRRIEEMSE